MTELLTAAQMRAIEQAAIEAGEVTGLELMERAGRGVVEAVFEAWPELAKAPHRAVVLCGPGNNGGDGFVVARLLKEWGWEVEVFLYVSAKNLPQDARTNFEKWRDLGPIGSIDKADLVDIWNSDLVFDALFGTGLSRSCGALAQRINQSASDARQRFLYRGKQGRLARLVSIDIASGTCSDSGATLSPNQGRGADQHRLHPTLTVTFHRPKLCHHLTRDEHAGAPALRVKSIGLEKTSSPMHQTSGPKGNLVQSDVVHVLHAPNPSLLWKTGHKYSNGHALSLSGGSGKTGAARLAARGALRIGAGLVTLGVPPAAQQEVACQITSLMLTRISDPEGLTGMLQDGRLNALCLGPGLGLDENKAALVEAALAAGRRMVLDADALTLVAQDSKLFEKLHETCVLTPHGGEFTRLFPDIAEKLNAPPVKGPAYSKVDATREAAARAGCVVLFKGPDTVIASPDGRCSINSAHYERAAPWLATAGSGDVLAGFITGLLARGFEPMQAAETAAWLHVECARSFGPGLIAEDLPEELPKVFRALGV